MYCDVTFLPYCPSLSLIGSITDVDSLVVPLSCSRVHGFCHMVGIVQYTAMKSSMQYTVYTGAACSI